MLNIVSFGAAVLEKKIFEAFPYILLIIIMLKFKPLGWGHT